MKLQQIKKALEGKTLYVLSAAAPSNFTEYKIERVDEEGAYFVIKTSDGYLPSWIYSQQDMRKLIREKSYVNKTAHQWETCYIAVREEAIYEAMEIAAQIAADKEEEKRKDKIAEEKREQLLKLQKADWDARTWNLSCMLYLQGGRKPKEAIDMAQQFVISYKEKMQEE